MGGMLGGGGGGGGGFSAEQHGSGGPGVDYSAPASASPEAMANRYTSQYTPQTATPFLQSVMSQHGSSPLQQSNSLGLPSLQSMFNMPQRGSPIQPTGIQQLAPMAPYMGSTYRPDMSGVMANLNNVMPSVATEQARAAAAQAKYDAENPAPPPSSDSGGGGG